MKKFDMNLSDSYVEKWGTWEALREIVSNAMDADENYKLEKIDEDNVVVCTSTVPKLSELRVIGCSRSRGDKKKIGQFGEGFKLAALALTRQGDVLRLVTPLYIASFAFEIDDFGEVRTLKMIVEEKETETIGSKFFISAKSVGNLFEGKFLETREKQLLEKEFGNLNIYYKGIWVSDIKHKSLFDYSLDNFDLNRDRSIVNEWSFAYDAAYFLSERMSVEIAKKIVDTPESYELNLIKRFPSHFGSSAKKVISDAVALKYGNNILTSTDDSESNQLATARGKKVVRLPDGLEAVCDIQTTKEFLSSTVGFNQIAESKYQKEIKELVVFLDLFSVHCEIKIFENNQDTSAILGKADSLKNTIWLNERLFLGGNKKERIATVIHEIAHLISKAEDASIAFEVCLSKLLGELGIRFLEIQHFKFEPVEEDKE